MAEPLIEAQDVYFSWPTGPAVDGVSFAVEQGEMTAVVGPNGAGKSTLLRLLSGYLKPARGEISLAGRNIERYDRRDVARALAFVPQYSEINLPYKVRELAMLSRYARLGPFRAPGPGDRDAVAKSLELAGVAGLAERPLNQLSGGEFQRAMLARALAQEPSVLFLDEPTAHLDISHQVQIFSLLADLNVREALTGVAVLHDLNAAAAFFPRVILLANGKVEADGAAADVLNEYALSKVYGCVVKTRTVEGRTFIFPETRR